MIEMEEEEESIIEYGNYSNYYVVQSPSSVSHANSTTTISIDDSADLCRNHQQPNYHLHHSPLQLKEEQLYNTKPLLNQITNSTTDLSPCSSSRASFVHQNNIIRMPAHHLLPPHAAADHHYANVDLLDNNSAAKNNKKLNNNNKMIVPATTYTSTGVTNLGKVEHGEEEYYNYDNDEQGKCCQYFSFNTYTSPVWITLQLVWRFLISAMLALLVFYLVTKPPPPNISLKVIGVKQFELTEGVDLTGVATTLLSCNISTALIIDNKSKVFGVHILSPVVDIYFGRVPFVISQGSKMYIRSREWREVSVYAGTMKKAMYG
ncbi:hypothetical protein SOVF_165310, partial [Spinacia oleracea]